MVDLVMRPFALNFCLQRWRTRHISKITCLLQTETVADRCLVAWQINVSLLPTNIKLLLTSFDLLTERLMSSVTDRLHFAATSFSLLLQLCAVDNGMFYMAGVNIFCND